MQIEGEFVEALVEAIIIKGLIKGAETKACQFIFLSFFFMSEGSNYSFITSIQTNILLCNAIKFVDEAIFNAFFFSEG